jgi:hypothetical protein
VVRTHAKRDRQSKVPASRGMVTQLSPLIVGTELCRIHVHRMSAITFQAFVQFGKSAEAFRTIFVHSNIKVVCLVAGRNVNFPSSNLDPRSCIFARSAELKRVIDRALALVFISTTQRENVVIPNIRMRK